MRFLYTILFYTLTPFILIRLYWKSRKLKAYRERLSERFSLHSRPKHPVDIWVHAVSLGEVVAAAPLICSFLESNLKVCVTTMTPTGSAEVLRRFGDRLLHQYVPYDLPYALRRFFKRLTPRVGIIMETELWPNLIGEAKDAGVALFLANARISDRAYPKYKRIAWFLRPILRQFSCIMAQSPRDVVRYQVLGGKDVHVKMLGNLKFDVTFSISNLEPFRAIKTTLGQTRPVVMLASTHNGEERLLLSKMKTLQALVPEVLIWIAPRHPERFQSVFELCCLSGYKTGLRSQPETLNDQLDIVVIDSLGELLPFYSLCDYAFVGGSLVPIGGHNVLEPILVDAPVFCGPFMQNAQSVVDELVTQNAIIQVPDAAHLITAIAALYCDKSAREAQIKRAKCVLEENQGALLRHLDEIKKMLDIKGR